MKLRDRCKKHAKKFGNTVGYFVTSVLTDTLDNYGTKLKP